MSIRMIGGMALLAVVCAVPMTPAQAQRHGYGRDTVECRSQNYSREFCPVYWREARIVRQLSDTPCRRGENWGMGRRGIWVDRGCAAVFAEAGRYHHDRDRDDYHGWRPPHDWDREFRVGCESRNYQYRFCAVDVGGAGRARLYRQTSGARCIEGRTWGWNRAGIWVNGGCAGIFTIHRRWR